MKTLLWMATGLALAGCGQSDNNDKDNAGNSAVNEAAAQAPKHPTYCFFSDDHHKDWKASTDENGNVTVKGKAYLEDSAYIGALVQGEAQGDKASIWLQMAPNTTGYASRDGWWDVSGTIPNSAAVTSVTVMCGSKTAATVPVTR
jgi:hypothetical protein